MKKVFVENLILGSGFSGLSIGYALRRKGSNFLILEKTGSPGGLVSTYSVSDKNGITHEVENCIHIFHNRHEGELGNYVDNIYRNVFNLNQIKTSKQKAFYNGSFINYPVEFEDLDATIYHIPTDDVLDKQSLYDLSLKYYGKKFTEDYKIPYWKKWLKVEDLNNIEGSWLLGSYDKPITANSTPYNAKYYTNEKSSLQIAECFSEEVGRDHIRFDQVITKIDICKRTIHTKDAKYIFEKLFSTIPLNIFVSLTEDISLQVIAKQLSFRPLLIRTYIFKNLHLSEHLKDVGWLYFIEADISINRLVIFENVNCALVKDTFQIIQTEETLRDIDSKSEDHLKILKRLGVVKNYEDLVYSDSRIIQNAYNVIDTGTQTIVDEMSAYLSRYNIHLIGRYAEWKYTSISDALLDGLRI